MKEKISALMDGELASPERIQVLDAMNAFAVSLVLGIAVIFAGFLVTNTPRAVEEWHFAPRESVVPTPIRRRVS